MTDKYTEMASRLEQKAIRMLKDAAQIVAAAKAIRELSGLDEITTVDTFLNQLARKENTND